jgi:hypothetical protein
MRPLIGNGKRAIFRSAKTCHTAARACALSVKQRGTACTSKAHGGETFMTFG